MDMLTTLTVRDWMVIVGSLLILAVLIDAWRRMRAERRSRVRVNLARDAGADDADDLTMLRELPNGGARVVKREDLLAAQQRHADSGAGDDAGPTTQARPAGGAGSPERARPVAEAAPGTLATPDPEPLAGVRPERSEPANLDWLDDLAADVEPAEEEEAGALPRGVETEVIILHVVSADERGFDGKSILEILLACDLRFGDMDFFHRHEREAGRGPIQFSVANMLKPGVFDIDNMATMHTRGLVFFLTLPGPADMSQAFDYMLETARTVARNLDGELLDESRSVLTEQSVELARQRIRDLERRLLAQSH